MYTYAAELPFMVFGQQGISVKTGLLSAALLSFHVK